MNGRIVIVQEQYLGSTLAAALAGGETTLTVNSTADFDDAGTLYFPDTAETQAYTAVSSTGVITLVGTVASAHEEDAEVRVYPQSIERWATLKAGDSAADDEGLLARVPHALFDRIPVGIRDLDAGEGETVQADFISDQLVIVEMTGRAPLVDGTYIDPGTIATGSDGLPPGTSPAATVIAGIETLVVRWDPITNADIVTYDVYIDTSPSPAANPAKKVEEVTGGSIVFLATDAAGAALVVGTTYYVQIVARDVDGSAAPGTEDSGSPISNPSSSDGVAPASSPAVTLTAGPKFLHATWPAITNADTVYYLVYIGTASNPSSSGGNLVATTPALDAVISTTGAGVALTAGTTYHVQVVATDADGAAAAGTEATGTPLPDFGATDGIVPSTSPAIDHIVPGYSFFGLVWSPISNADPVVYEVHVGTSSGFTPGAGTLAMDTFGTAAVVKHLPSGAAFAYGTTYYFKLLAKDDDGPCATYGTQSSSTLAKIDGTSDITANSITAASIAADTITASEIAASAITTTELAANAVTAAKIAANTITASQITAGTITSTEIASSAITTAKLAAGAVTAAKITAGTITANEIAAATITAAKMVAGTITAASGIINDLSVSTLTTGTLTATVTISGSIKTASSGQRVEITSTGIKGYDGGSTDHGGGAGVTVSIPTSGSSFFYGTVVSDIFKMYVPASDYTAATGHSHLSWNRASSTSTVMATTGVYSNTGDLTVSYETHVFAGVNGLSRVGGTWRVTLQDGDNNSGGHTMDFLEFLIVPSYQSARTAYFLTPYYPVGSNSEVTNPVAENWGSQLALFYLDIAGTYLGSSRKGGVLSSFLAFGRSYGGAPGTLGNGSWGTVYAASLTNLANYDGNSTTNLSLARMPLLEEQYNSEDGTWGTAPKKMVLAALGSNLGFGWYEYDELCRDPSTISASGDANMGSFVPAWTAGGSASYTSSVAKHPGIWTLTTGTGSTTVANVRWGSSSIRPGDGRLRVGTLVRIPTASSSAQRFTVGFGIGSSGTFSTATHGAFFKYSDNLNSGKWQVWINTGSGASTVDSGITVTAGNWYYLEIEVSADGSTASWYINGALVSSAAGFDTTTYQTVLTGIEKTVGTTARTLDIDLMYVAGVASDRRWT